MSLHGEFRYANKMLGLYSQGSEESFFSWNDNQTKHTWWGW